MTASTHRCLSCLSWGCLGVRLTPRSSPSCSDNLQTSQMSGILPTETPSLRHGRMNGEASQFSVEAVRNRCWSVALCGLQRLGITNRCKSNLYALFFSTTCIHLQKMSTACMDISKTFSAAHFLKSSQQSISSFGLHAGQNNSLRCCSNTYMDVCLTYVCSLACYSEAKPRWKEVGADGLVNKVCYFRMADLFSYRQSTVASLNHDHKLP